MRQLLGGIVIFLAATAWPVQAQDNLPYTTYTSFDELIKGREARYAAVTRVSEPGSSARRVYTGFFFYQVLQFDATGRYLLGLRVYCQTRDVRPDDLGDIGYVDLKDGNKWTKIGKTTAWNWQQGARLYPGVIVAQAILVRTALFTGLSTTRSTSRESRHGRCRSFGSPCPSPECRGEPTCLRRPGRSQRMLNNRNTRGRRSSTRFTSVIPTSR